MIQTVPRLLRTPSTRGILGRLCLFAIVVRCVVHLPLRTGLPDLGPVFRADPFLALLDIFSGGALARGSAFALGVYPFLLGRLAARVLLPRTISALDLIVFQKRSYRFTVVTAIAMASVYPFFFNHLAGGRYLPCSFDAVLTLTTGALLTLWLGHQLDEDYFWPDEYLGGLRLFVVLHVLATLPKYLLWGSPSGISWWTRVLVTVLAAGFYLRISSWERRFPFESALQKEGRYGRKSRYLPFALNSSRVAPLLWLLATFAVIQSLASSLLTSETGWVRGLATVEQRLTSLRSPASWWLFCGLGLAIKTAYGLAVMSPFGTAARLRKEAAFIPGLRPGRPTGQYLLAARGRVVWIEPLLTMGMLLAVAYLERGARAAGFWPVFLVPVLYAMHPLSDLQLVFRSRLARVSYEGFMKQYRPLGGNGR